jgi:hypothetical protein
MNRKFIDNDGTNTSRDANDPNERARVQPPAVSGSASTVVTFTMENLMYIALLTASCWFLAHYFPILRIPALVFMFVDSVSVMACVHVVSTILIFSIRPKQIGGAFSDCVLAEVSQGFAIVTSLMWLGVLWCIFLDVPRIASVPGFPSSASAIVLAVVLGLSVVIPFIALVVTYAAVPSGAGNSLFFNGSTVGAASLLFFVTLSFGSAGATRCIPHEDQAARLFFGTLVLSYWCALLVLEVIVFLRVDVFESLWVMFGNDAETYYEYVNCVRVSWIDISVWRIFGCVLNVVIVASTGLYIKESQTQTLNIVLIVVAAVHVPMVFTIHIDIFQNRHDYEDSHGWDPVDDDEDIDQSPFVAYPATIPSKSNGSYPSRNYSEMAKTSYPQTFPFQQGAPSNMSNVEKRRTRYGNAGGPGI